MPTTSLAACCVLLLAFVGVQQANARWQLPSIGHRHLQEVPGDSPHNFYTQFKMRYIRKHVNDLDALLKFVVDGPVVTTSVFNKAYREFAANWYYTISRFGRVRNIVLVAYDTESLVECLNLGFACYNGTSLLSSANKGQAFVANDVSHGNPEYHKLMWGKPIFMYELLRRNYTVHYSDLDTVWLKDAVRSMSHALDEHDADVVGMNDQNGGKPNAGNLFIRHNPRTMKMMEDWLAHGKPSNDGQLRADFHDQQGLWNVYEKCWKGCSNAQECASVKASGMAAVWLHPWHGCPWEHNNYANSHWKGGICDNELAYIHIFCTAGGTKHKTEMASAIGVWFVDKEAPLVQFKGATGMEIIDLAESHKINNSPSLPCDNEIAWLDL